MYDSVSYQFSSLEAAVLIASALLAAIVFAFVAWIRPRAEVILGCTPPCRIAGFPVVGSTVSFGIWGIDYLAWAAQSCDEAFSVDLAFQTYTFLTSPNCLRAFNRASKHELALEPAVQHITTKVFGLSNAIWKDGSTVLHAFLASALSPAHMQHMSSTLCEELMRLVPTYFGADEVDLTLALPAWIIHATTLSLFGASFLAFVPIAQWVHLIHDFDAELEAAASPLPHVFLPAWSNTRSKLREIFARAVDAKAIAPGSIAGQALGRLPPSEHTNGLLALAWAGLSNISATAFWAVAFLLVPENRTWHDLLVGSLKQALTTAAAEQRSSGNNNNNNNGATSNTGRVSSRSSRASGDAAVLVRALLLLTQADGSLPTLCVKEALRLRAQSILLREAASDVIVQGTKKAHGNIGIPMGCKVAVSPYLIGHDPRFFTSPGRYYPLRHVDARALSVPFMKTDDSLCSELERPDPYPLQMVFGQGAFLCPGRNFAMQHLSLSVAVFFSLLDMKLDPKHQSLASADVQGSGDATDDSGHHGRSVSEAPGRSDSENVATETNAAMIDALWSELRRGSGRPRTKNARSSAAAASEASCGPNSLAHLHGADQAMHIMPSKADIDKDARLKVPTWLGSGHVLGGHVCARGVTSGDPAGRLPAFDKRRMIGVKVPVEPCIARHHDVAQNGSG